MSAKWNVSAFVEDNSKALGTVATVGYILILGGWVSYYIGSANYVRGYKHGYEIGNRTGWKDAVATAEWACPDSQVASSIHQAWINHKK